MKLINTSRLIAGLNKENSMNETRRTRTGLMLLSIAMGTFMSGLDSSVVSIAAPVIKDYFNVTLGNVEWVVTVYLLVVTCALLFFGRLSDLLGHKKIYLAGFAVFTLGSLLCGFSVSIEMLIALRALQALGAAMMMSCSSAIITDNVPEKNRGKAFSVSAIALAVALCTGPVLGGTLAGIFGWQSIFFINIPIGIAGLTIGYKFIPSDNKRTSLPQDYPGAAMAFAALFLILLPLDQLSEGMNPIIFAALLAAGIVLVPIFIIYEKKTKYPMLNLRLFNNRTFSASIAASFLNYTAQFIMVFLAPFYLEDIRMFPPAITGLLYMPMPIAILIVAPVSGALSDRINTRILSSAGMGVMAVGLIMLSFMGADSPYWYIIIAMIACGIGSGMFQTPNNTALMGSAPQDCRGIASGMLAIARNLGMVIGVALSGLMFTAISGKGIPNGTVSVSDQGLFINALHITFIAAGAFAVFAVVASLTKEKKRTDFVKEIQQTE